MEGWAGEDGCLCVSLWPLPSPAHPAPLPLPPLLFIIHTEESRGNANEEQMQTGWVEASDYSLAAGTAN